MAVKALTSGAALRSNPSSATKDPALARFPRILDTRKRLQRSLGLRLAWLALAFNLLGALALPVLPVAAAARSAQTAVVCTAQGIRVVALDADGRPMPPTHDSAVQCLFCLPLLKQGAAAPVAAPAAPVAAEPVAVAPPVAEVRPAHFRLRLAARPRAPPFA